MLTRKVLVLPMESLYEQTTTVAAPPTVVWSEICSLPRLLDLSPEVARFTESSPDKAHWDGRMTWGPLALRFSGVGEIDEAIPDRYLSWSHVLSRPRGMCFEGVFALSEQASHTTRLTYRAMFHVVGKRTSRLLDLLGVTIDDHVRLMVDQVKYLAEQHWQAEVKLGAGSQAAQE